MHSLYSTFTRNLLCAHFLRYANLCIRFCYCLYTTPSEQCELAELVLVNMFLNIPKHEILTAFDAMITAISKAPRSVRQCCKVFSAVSISKLDKCFDALGLSPCPENFIYLKLQQLRDYVAFEIDGNHLSQGRRDTFFHNSGVSP